MGRPTLPVEALQVTVNTWARHGQDYESAAQELGISRSALYARVKQARGRGMEPDGVPVGHDLRGVSTMYDAEGNVKLRWVKTAVERERREELLLKAIADAMEERRGRSAKTPIPRRTEKALLAVYPLGDPHIGMYAWAEEAGEDFDCEIAETQLCAAVDRLVDAAPSAETCLILNLGDFYHSDTQLNRTARSGNPLDVDTRWARVLEIGVRLMIRCIQRALSKHKKVIVRNNIGNHDEHTSQMLGLALKLYFENNSRVQVETSPSSFWYYRFGKVLIGSTHGDTAKPNDLGPIMATDRPDDWGKSEYRYWYVGHIHHRRVQDFHGCEVESFRTLAARDAWHSREGYRARRDMQAIIHHADFGEVGRHRVDVRML